jgi:hypothetical protein
MKPCSGIIAALVVSLAACGGGVKPYDPSASKARTLFLPSMRTVGPEPVYSRTRWTQPPEVLPQRERPGTSDSDLAKAGPPLRPVFQLNLKNVSMEEAARVLAATSRYQSYTDPSIAKQKITIENLGTIDELARLIERKAQVQVVVDHAGREVRFLPATGEPPKLFSE